MAHWSKRLARNRIEYHTYRPGERIVFASRIRPDLLPSDSTGRGVVLKVSVWSVWIAFDDFPDEVLRLGANEIRRETGFLPPNKKRPNKPDKTRWVEWNAFVGEPQKRKKRATK